MDAAVQPKKRGRPKGSKNRSPAKRAADERYKLKTKIARRSLPPGRKPKYGGQMLVCANCHYPADDWVSVAEVQLELDKYSELGEIPYVYQDESPVRIVAHLVHGLSALYGVPPAYFRTAFLAELRDVVYQVHPKFKRSALRACLEGRLTATAPFSEVPVGMRNRLDRVLEVCDLLELLADRRLMENKRNAYLEEAKADGVRHSTWREAGLGEDAVEGGERDVRQAGEEEGRQEEEEIAAAIPKVCEIFVPGSDGAWRCSFCRCIVKGEAADDNECPWCGASVYLPSADNVARVRLYRNSDNILIGAHSQVLGYKTKGWCVVCGWSGSLVKGGSNRCPTCFNKNGDDFLEANLRWQQLKRRLAASGELPVDVAEIGSDSPPSVAVES